MEALLKAEIIINKNQIKKKMKKINLKKIVFYNYVKTIAIIFIWIPIFAIINFFKNLKTKLK